MFNKVRDRTLVRSAIFGASAGSRTNFQEGKCLEGSDLTQPATSWVTLRCWPSCFGGTVAQATVPGCGGPCVDSIDIINGEVKTIDLADSAVTSAKIADGTIARIDIALDAINASKILDESIRTADIGSLQVTGRVIAADAVTASKIAADAVGSSEIATDAVDSAEIAHRRRRFLPRSATDAVGSDELAADAVGSSEIGDRRRRLRRDRRRRGRLLGDRHRRRGRRRDRRRRGRLCSRSPPTPWFG